MAKKPTTWLVLVVISLALMGAAGVAWVALPSAGTTVTVGPAGAQYKTIQAAVDAAPDGSTIQIAAGTYKENVTIRNRAGLTLQGASQATVTLDGNGPQQKQTDLIPGILIDKSASITIRSLTITNSRRGIYVSDSTLVVLDGCVLDRNLRRGVYMSNSQAQISNTAVRGTKDDIDGAVAGDVIVDSGSQVVLDRDTISGGRVGIAVQPTCQATITNTQVSGVTKYAEYDHDKSSTGDGIDLFPDARATIRDCTLSGTRLTVCMPWAGP